MSQTREFIVRGNLREMVEVPELGLGIAVSWTDGKTFTATVTRFSVEEGLSRIRTVAKRLPRNRPKSS